jgi:hypothetical protein
MTDESDPPRKHYKLGEAKFERVNAAAPAAEDSSISNQAAGGAKPAEPPKESDVHKILLENRAVDKDAGLFDVAPVVKRPSRRKRDYWLLLLMGNGFFSIPLAYWGLRSIPGLFAGAGIIFFSISLTWVMWLIIDDY